MNSTISQGLGEPIHRMPFPSQSYIAGQPRRMYLGTAGLGSKESGNQSLERIALVAAASLLPPAAFAQEVAVVENIPDDHASISGQESLIERMIEKAEISVAEKNLLVNLREPYMSVMKRVHNTSDAMEVLAVMMADSNINFATEERKDFIAMLRGYYKEKGEKLLDTYHQFKKDLNFSPLQTFIAADTEIHGHNENTLSRSKNFDSTLIQLGKIESKFEMLYRGISEPKMTITQEEESVATVKPSYFYIQVAAYDENKAEDGLKLLHKGVYNGTLKSKSQIYKNGDNKVVSLIGPFIKTDEKTEDSDLAKAVEEIFKSDEKLGIETLWVVEFSPDGDPQKKHWRLRFDRKDYQESENDVSEKPETKNPVVYKDALTWQELEKRAMQEKAQDGRTILDVVIEKSNKHEIDPLLVLSLIQVESGFNYNATGYKLRKVGASKSGKPIFAYVVDEKGDRIKTAMGYMQITPDTLYETLGIKYDGSLKAEKKVRSIETNIEAGIMSLRSMYNKIPVIAGVTSKGLLLHNEHGNHSPDDIEKIAIAAYNCGAGNTKRRTGVYGAIYRAHAETGINPKLGKTLKVKTDDILNNLPPESKRHVDKVFAQYELLKETAPNKYLTSR
ncbi:MAG TPA: transglycosylase SLT domain-containing protein [Candidatus Nanoarchaeia archaeon]|nr:transglycosylase SLT domain-containing protein [Candidatus Nanoarchaeia archaeon]